MRVPGFSKNGAVLDRDDDAAGSGLGSGAGASGVPEPEAAGGRRLPPAPPVLPAPRRRARRGLLAAGIVLSILFALGAYVLVERSGERVSVIGTAKDIAWGEVITQSDLVQVQVVQDPALRTVPWSSAGSVVGQRAAMDLPAGALLTGSSVQASTSIPPAGKALVGVRVSVGQVPSTALSPGDQVVIVRTGDASATGRATQAQDLAASAIPAEVFAVSMPAAGSTDRTVDVLVDDDPNVALRLAAMSAAGEASIVLLPR